MRTPGDDGGLAFPVTTANALAELLDQAASRLDTATAARVRAAPTLTDFRGAYADRYREGIQAHGREVADLVARLRSSAGRLRDALDDYETLRRRASGVTV